MKSKSIYYLGLILLFLLQFSTLFAQNTILLPTVKTSEKKAVTLNQFHVSVSIVGNFAVTTYEMSFKNSENRILEGQLELPMAVGENVVGYQLEVNGKMRKGVVVEKEDARQIFEEVVNRKVDPGYIEKIEGNTYRTRLYPIPANGTKKIIISTQQTLYKDNGDIIYNFPFQSNAKIPDFSLEIEIMNIKTEPVIKKSFSFSSFFKPKDKGFYLKISSENQILDTPVQLSIPSQPDQNVQIFEKSKNEQFFFFKSPIDTSMVAEQKIFSPDTIYLLWDVSFSGLKRDLQKEILLVKELMNAYPQKPVTIVPFSYKIFPFLHFNSMDTSSIFQTLNQFIYDGSTQINLLQTLNISMKSLTFIFSDGLTSLGENIDQNIHLGTSYSIVSSVKNNPELLKKITHRNPYFLVQMNPDKIIEEIYKRPLKILKLETMGAVTDLTIHEGDIIQNEIVVCGKWDQISGNIQLSYGYDDSFLYTKTINLVYDTLLDVGLQKTEIATVISRYWAQNKIDQLSLNENKNKNKIKYFSRKYGIVTNYTSLLVLESMADYIRYNVDPPEELQAEYNTYVSRYGKNTWNNNNQTNMEQSPKTVINSNFLSYYDAIINWYDPAILNLQSQYRKQTETKVSVKDPIVLDSIISYKNSPKTGSISGIVYDLNTKKPLSGIQVTLIYGSQVMQSQMTGIDGKYSFASLFADLYSINVTCDTCMFNQVNNFVFVEENKNNRLDIGFQNKKLTPGRDINSILTSAEGLAVDTQGNTVVRGNRSDGQRTVVDGVQVHVSERELNKTVGRSVETKSANNATSPNSTVFYSDVDNNVAYEYTPEINTNSNSQTIPPKPKNEVTLNQYNSNSNYMQSFSGVVRSELYKHYLTIRNEYQQTPSFFVEVADMFFKNGMTDTAKMILSNIIEISNQNDQIIQEYGNKLIEYAQYKDAVPAFKFITELREEFPQSFRDYALACELAGDYQEAYDVMLSILSKSWKRFDNIKMIVYTEFNELIANHKFQIILHDFDPQLYAPMPMKLRVVLTWNTDNCDIDLHVVEPDGAKCFYSHRFTQLGGKLSYDFTQGFGPEEYVIKNNVDGIYQIFAQYYSTTSQAQLLPVIVYADIYTDYGTSTQTHKRVSLKLKQKNDTYEIGIVEIEPEPEK
jgi:hypothetical protein